MTNQREVAVTGAGAVSAWGWTLETLWRGLAAGATSVDEARRFDVTGQRTSLASEVDDDAAPPPRDDDAWRHATRADRFALAAVDEAWRNAGLGAPREEGVVGLYFGGSTAGMDEAEEYFAALIAPASVDYLRPRIARLATHPLNGPGDVAARSLGLDGPVITFSSACASGGLAVGAAVEALRDGTVDVAIAGGADALCKVTYSGFNALRAVDAAACSPFRAERAGLNLGEGAGALVLEPLERARARGAEVLAVVRGHGASCDAHHMTAPHPEGEGAARAIAAALADAGVEPDAVAFVNAHGTGTPLNDRAESRALATVFGERARTLPVTSTKGLLGHFLGSSGAIEAVATALCLRHGQVHPTPGRGPIDPDLAVDLVTDAPRPFAGGVAVSTSFAFGGSNAAVVLGAAPHAARRAESEP
ncbi:MAG: beta-ketoacyl-[acyl-carrier-protein] synthase family protein [Acidobacteriota bacterium]